MKKGVLVIAILCIGVFSALLLMPSSDLIKAEATNGKIGYISRTEMETVDGSHVQNPSEALAYMEWAEEHGPFVINVYEKDGKTVIGEFVID